MLKLSTRKILGIAIGTLALIAASLAISNDVLRAYLQVGILASVVGASVVLLGWARPRRRDNLRLIATLVILAAVVFQIAMFLLLGLKLGFVQNVYGWNFNSLFCIFLPTILTIVAEEVLRGQLVEKGKGSIAAVILVGATIWLIQIITTLPLYNLSEPKAIFTFFVIVAGPALLMNTLLTYIAYAYDYRTGLTYRLIMDLPAYLLPILPSADVYLTKLFEIGFICILVFALAGLYYSEKRRQAPATAHERTRLKRPLTDRQQRTRQIVKWAITGVIIIAVTLYAALMSGLFKYHFLAVGSGSMEPNLFRGDMVLVEKTQDYDKLQAGDILVYHHDNVTVIHRIETVTELSNQYVFQTKGDANASLDAWQVKQDEVIGIAKGKIAMFGFPTLWLNELFNGEK